MKKKYKLKKSAIVILILFFILILALIKFIVSINTSKSYSLEYNYKKYEISENYNDEEKYYYYEISKDNLKYNFIYNSEYLKDKKLIKEIKEYTDEDFICLTIKSNHIKSNPLCSKKETIIDYHLVSDKLKNKLSKYYKNTEEVEKKHENYKIYNEDNNILIWSYKGFNYLEKNNIEYIKLFKKDIYEIPLATKINNYLFVPDYEQEHTFNRVYLINLDNLEVEKWKLKYEISFDSYILGINNKSIYLIDNKNKKEYELVPHKQKMRIIATSKKQGIVYNENQIQKISMNKLVSKEYSFTYKNNYKYILEDNTLYLKYLDTNIKTKISNKKVTSIVEINKDNIYYLVKDTLYKYNLTNGEVKLITYSEWKFNYNNLIFINN